MSWVVMSHPDVVGTATVTVTAFNAVWEDRGWEIVEPEASAVYLPADMHYQGAWNSGRLYAPGNVVSHLGSAWVALEPSVGDIPGTDPEWATAATSDEVVTSLDGGSP